MLELPGTMREWIIEQIDENFEAVGAEGTDEQYAQAVLDAIEFVAEEHADEIGDEIVSHLEASGELDHSLKDTLTEGFSSDPDIDYIGAKVMGAVERLCHIEWEEEAGVDFFTEEDEY